MTLFIPSLDKTPLYTSSDEIKDISSTIERLLSGCRVFHKIDIDSNFIEDKRALDWFDYIIVHPDKGTICINNSGKPRDPDLTDMLLNKSEEILPNRIEFIVEVDIKESLKQAQIKLGSWSCNIKYEKSIETIVPFLKEVMQIDSLPPRKFSGKISVNDQRFIRLSTNYGVIKDITEPLDQLEKNSFKKIQIHVKATAGSGKTLAAKYAYQRLSKRGLKILFVCYNHLLGKWLRNELDKKNNSYAGTLYHFSCSELKKHDNKYPGGWQNHAQILLEKIESGQISIDGDSKFDVLIVDEGQDFWPDWFELLKHYLKPNSSILWFEDETQNILWNNSNAALDYSGVNNFNGFFMVGKNTPNCRTPQEIHRFMINFFSYYDSYMKSKFRTHIKPSQNKIDGLPVKTIFYQKQSFLYILKNRIDTLIAQGIKKENIAIISCLPSNTHASSLLKRDSIIPYSYDVNTIGGYVLQRENGHYDADAHKIYYHTDNGIRCESIYKYKGLEDAVILAIDIEKPSQFSSDEWAKRLYCTFSRATLMLEIFVDSSGNMKQCFDFMK